MKKLNLNCMLMLVALACVLVSTKTNSQFTAASASEFSAGVNVDSRATGNDVKDFGSNTYRVSVWDDVQNNTSPGLEYRVTYLGTLYKAVLAFGNSTDVIDPDVCLVTDGSSKIYAIVVYYVSGSTNAFYWDLYTWSFGSTSFSLTSSNVFAHTHNYSTAVNIDGNDNGDFAIIWDDSYNGDIEFLTGSTTAPNLPTLNNSGNAVTSSIAGYYPDVSLYYDYNSGNPINRVNYTYTDGSGNLYVKYDNFSNLAGGSFSTNNVYSISPASGYIFSESRIASPTSAGNTKDWTVVATESNGTLYKIFGYAVYNGTGLISPIIYNNGVPSSPYNTTADFNLHPVVAYDSHPSNYHIWIGWTYNDSNGNCGTVAAYPMVLKCKYDGNIPASSTYWLVPTALNTNDQVDFLSLAARYSSATSGMEKLFLTYHNITLADIYTKQVSPVTALSFRITENSSAFNQAMSGSYAHWLNNFTTAGNCTFTMFDLSGKQVMHQRGSISEISAALNNFTKNISPSLFLVHLISDDDKFNYSGKILAGN